MMRFQSSLPARSPFTLVLALTCATSALAAAGCSTDVTRFDQAMFADDTTTGSISRSGGPVETALTDQTPPVTYGGGSLPPSRPYVPRETYESRRAYPAETNQVPVVRPVKPRPVRVADASPAWDDAKTLNDGTPLGRRSVTVRSGDTLYGISRRTGVSIAAIKSTNGLTTDVIRPGQTLALPGGSSIAASSNRRQPDARSYKAPRAPRSVPRVPSYSAAGDSTATYTVRAGDSLYGISRATGVSVAELTAINGITNPRRVMPGTVLKLRRDEAAPRYASRNEGRGDDDRSNDKPSKELRPGDGRTAVDARIINQPSNRRTMTDAAPQRDVPRAGDRLAMNTNAGELGGKFRWPARGRIVSGFGPRDDGSHNDGIDISVPRGTDIHAAEAGVVAYADSELQAYGNLILVRHDNGWVSAYAHADRMLVKRGDRVERGQVIAKAGTTGSVDRPTVHFELRDGSKPVDPEPLLAR